MKLVAAALAALLAVGGTAFAQASDPEAKRHYDQAMAAYGLGRYAEAAEEFEKAYERKPQPALLFNAAQAHREAGHRERALVLYRNYLHEYGSQASNGADVQRIIEQLEKEPAKSPPPAAPAPPAIAAPTENALVAPAPAPEQPLYKRGWFWGVVGGGAVVVAGVIAISVVYGSSTKNPTPTIGTWAY